MNEIIYIIVMNSKKHVTIPSKYVEFIRLCPS